MKLKKLFALLFILNTVSFIFVAVVINKYQKATIKLEDAYNMQYKSLILADELRQSSDDLTRMARTYVITGNPMFEEQYKTVLAIRNGELPRPKRYNGIFWDFLTLEGIKPLLDGEKIPLRELMKNANFPESELNLLFTSQNESDDLTNLEHKAMNAIKGIFQDENGNYKFEGRFNQGVVTINLVDVACSSNGDMDKFWDILEERLELCHRALRCRHERLKGAVSDVAPILWQHGALARLKKGEKIDKLLYDGYSTISLGYAGLYEMCVRMTGKSHTSDEGKEFALKVMQKLNDKCNEWKAAENISYSVYGTPMESTTYKFAKCLQKRFGIIKGVTDKNYITNSYHVHVSEKIDAFKKLKFEADFQKLSPGGAISYIEVPNMQNNIPAVLSVMQYIYNNIMYAELNTKSDYCECCGYDGEIQIKEDENGKLIWECPNCGNQDQDKLFVARRTCGYIGTQFWNQGRTQEIKDRVLHL